MPYYERRSANALQIWLERPVADTTLRASDGASASAAVLVYVAGAEVPELGLISAVGARYACQAICPPPCAQRRLPNPLSGSFIKRQTQCLAPQSKSSSAVCSVTSADALQLVDKVKARHGTKRWVPPEEPMYPQIAGQAPQYQWSTTQGRDRRRWGLEKDLATFNTCPDTAWSATYWTHDMVRAMLALPASPRDNSHDPLCALRSHAWSSKKSGTTVHGGMPSSSTAHYARCR